MDYRYISYSIGYECPTDHLHLRGGGLQVPQKPCVWTSMELSLHSCLSTIEDSTQYRIVVYLSTNSPELAPSGVSTVQIPLEILLP